MNTPEELTSYIEATASILSDLIIDFNLKRDNHIDHVNYLLRSSHDPLSDIHEYLNRIFNNHSTQDSINTLRSTALQILQRAIQDISDSQ